MSMNIRKYQRSDYDGLIALLGKEYKSNISQQVLEKNYISSSKTILIADDNGRVAGCTFVELQTDYIRPRKIAYVTYVAVDQNFRKQGIGRALIQSVEEICGEKHCDAIELTSANYRTEAHSFYQSLGFTRKATTLFIKETGSS